MNIVKQLKLTPLERFVHFRREQMDGIVEKWNATHKRQIDYQDVSKALHTYIQKRQAAAHIAYQAARAVRAERRAELLASYRAARATHQPQL